MLRVARVSRPIFIVGSGRSGTTLVYELMCRHPHLAWFSNYVDKSPQFPQLAFISRFAAMWPLPRLQRYIPRPVEGYRVWDACAEGELPLEGPLDQYDVRHGELQCINEMVSRVMRYQGKPRFVNKNTRNSIRIPFLMEIFDDPFFIHVIRDPRAAIASLLRVDFWPHLRVWSQGGVTPIEWRASGQEEVVLAADLWRQEVGEVLKAQVSIPSDRYIQIRYEELVSDPQASVAALLQFCGLSMDPAVLEQLRIAHIDDRNVKYRNYLSPQQIELIEEMVWPVAGRLGYER